MNLLHIFSSTAICLLLGICCAGQTFIREEIFNDQYALTWEPNFDTETITFHLTVNTTGFVGFGLSPNGGMTGADIVIGGVHPNGTSYFKDYHATGNSRPVEDLVQDWQLISATENATHTELVFSRNFDTCDEEDNAITEGSTQFIWSFGATDEISYHLTNRGSSTVNILDPPMPEADLSTFEEWKVTTNMTMPPVDTSYWCTIHKRPTIVGKRHVVGFGPFTPSAEAVKHSHHIVVFECTPPAGQTADETFGPYVNYIGEECNYLDQSGVMDYCRRVLFTWATGGKVALFPEDVGFPINEPGQEESTSYVKMEFHYDNPDVLTNVTFESGLTIYHTAELRPAEAGLLLVDHRLWPTHLIPPGATDYVTVGHCSPECTRQNIPESGINLFNVFLHSHLAGRKLRLRHFRDGVELPWIANDEHYNFNFQQARPLRNHVQVLPGDHLAYECGTDTSDRNTTTLAGLSTRHEMCESFAWYYPRVGFGACGSYYHHTEELFKQYGVDNVTWDLSHFDPTVTAPDEHAGKLWSQVLDELEWTPEKIAALGQQLRYSDHVMYSCGEDLIVKYPEALEEYQPPQTCSSQTDNPSTATPTDSPTNNPTDSPTNNPTDNPTDSPTNNPTNNPTDSPTNNPTDNPTDSPTNNPTDSPTNNPTDIPTDNPTGSPTDNPTDSPTNIPTGSPTDNPTDSPTNNPTGSPTDNPTGSPTDNPTGSPTDNPTGSPTDNPTGSPTGSPTVNPTTDSSFATSTKLPKGGLIEIIALVAAAHFAVSVFPDF